MKLKKRIEVAKIGNWNGIDLTDDMLKQMHSNFQKVPIRPGHTTIVKGQKTDGAILESYYNNGVLSADIELSDQLADDYSNNKYISWSLDAGKYDNGWNITALALLGAEKPAIKGLKELQFSEDNQTLNITFTEEEANMLTPEEIKSIATSIVEAMAEERKKLMDDIDKKYEEINEARAKAGVSFSESETVQKLTSELEKANIQLAEFAEKEKTAAERLKADHNTKVEARKAEIMQFSEPEAIQFESLFKDKPETAIFMERYSVKDTRVPEPNADKLEFSEGGKPAKTESVTEYQLRMKKEKRGK